MRRLRSGILWALAGAGLACGDEDLPERTPARPRHALVITLDTTRADALTCYGGRPGITPQLDALAAESVLYENARAVTPLTLPSHCSVFTGLYPPRHSVRTNGLMALPAEAGTLAERARAAGMQTAAFVSALVLDGNYGLSQGFGQYGQPPRVNVNALRIKDTPGDKVVRAATAWLKQHDPERPFFLWVHLFDPHEPYEPQPQFRERAPDDPYLGDVAQADDAVGYLLGKLREFELWDDTMIVVVGDHGEGRGEHGEATHSTLCYDSTLRIPFLIRYPDGWGAGRRVADVVSNADVYPTLVEALGLGEPGDVDGISLFGRHAPADRGVYFESYDGYLAYGWSPLTGWADARGKYLHSSSPEWFDLRADPSEKNNLAAASGTPLEPYRAQIRALGQRPALAATRGELDPSILAAVQSLGYAGAGDEETEFPDLLDTKGLPSPRERMDELYLFYKGSFAGEQGDFPEAVRLLRQVVERNPRNATALDLLSYFLNQTRAFEEALGVLRTLEALGGPERHSMHTNFGHAYEQLGDDDRALQHFQRAAELQPSGILILRDWARLLEKTGQTQQAAAVRARIADLGAKP